MGTELTSEIGHYWLLNFLSVVVLELGQLYRLKFEIRRLSHRTDFRLWQPGSLSALYEFARLLQLYLARFVKSRFSWSLVSVYLSNSYRPFSRWRYLLQLPQSSVCCFLWQVLRVIVIWTSHAPANVGTALSILFVSSRWYLLSQALRSIMCLKYQRWKGFSLLSCVDHNARKSQCYRANWDYKILKNRKGKTKRVRVVVVK